MRSPLLSLLALTLTVCCPDSLAQITNVTNSTSTPTPGVGHDYIKMLGETIDIANGALSLRVAIPAPPGRRLTLPFAFAYDSNSMALQPVQNFPGFVTWQGNQNVLESGYWSYTLPQLSDTVLIYTDTLPGGSNPCYATTGYVFTDSSGGRHQLGLSAIVGTSSTCSRAPWTAYTHAGDDYFSASIDNFVQTYYQAATGEVRVADPDGTVYYF